MITKIFIQNFKSILKAEIELPRFAVLVGKNGSGKSNLISAVTILRDLARGDALSDVLQPIAPFARDIFHWNSNSLETVIRLEFGTLEEKNYEFEIKIVYATEKSRRIISSESLIEKRTQGERRVFERRLDNVTFFNDQGESEKVPLKLDSNRSILASYSDEDVQSAASFLSSCVIVDGFYTEHNKGDSIAFRGSTIHVSASQPEIHTLDGIAVALFKKSPIQFKAAIEAVKEIIPDFEPPRVRDLEELFVDKKDLEKPQKSEDSEESKQSSYFVMWRSSDVRRGFSSAAMSGGNIRTIHLIFSLFYTQPKSILLGEEIENGIHPERIAKLLDLIDTFGHNCKVQILLTTHSPEALNYVKANTVLLCVKDDRNGSIYKRLDQSEHVMLAKTALNKGELTARELMDLGII